MEWLGELADSSALLDAIDLFAMISEPAGCPNASLEAMARGLPVIATDVGGASEQVVDGLNGRLVPRGDTAALAAALVELGRDATKRRAMGDAGERAPRLASTRIAWSPTTAASAWAAEAVGLRGARSPPGRRCCPQKGSAVFSARRPSPTRLGRA